MPDLKSNDKYVKMFSKEGIEITNMVHRNMLRHWTFLFRCFMVNYLNLSLWIGDQDSSFFMAGFASCEGIAT